MTTNETNHINRLFIKLEEVTKWANRLNLRCVTHSENLSYHTVYEESLLELVVLQKQIIRALLKAGEVGELLSHIEAGTFPQFSIQAAFGRLALAA